MGPFYENKFVNEPDTDWSLTANRIWGEGIREKWMRPAEEAPKEIPVVVGGEEIFQGREHRQFIDSGRYHEKIVTARYALGTAGDAERAVAVAREDPDGWRTMSYAERNEILARAAMELRKARGDLIGAAAANTGKVYTESDPEVSEAIDFTEFYPWTTNIYTGMENVRCEGKGVGLVISPWNFPIAIPTGGMAASLAAGNTVVFKPASAAAAVAWEICQCFWRAGVSKNTLQFLPCSGSSVGEKLTNHPDVDYIILTGGTDTGMRILQERPGVYLAAETGGKNATIVTAMSDRDQAIKNVLHSAYSNTGQKCSATSLLILEKEVYEDAHFREALVDAAKSLYVGSPWRFRNKVGPLIGPPDGDLLRGLTTLEPGESWALQPENREENPYLWSPGIKWGVQPGSYTHMTEFFGPVLGVMCADDLDHAIELVNMTGYGLTSGLESLDRREQAKWKASLRAGNLYVNRGTTGAIVLRQPFGGMGKSALGAGIKAGSPNYVTQFMTFQENDPPPIGAIQNDYRLLRVAQEWRLKLDWAQHRDVADDLRKTVRAIESYLYHYEQEFSREKDYFKLRGQDNLFRYLPVGTVVVRLHEADTLFDVVARIAAVKVTGCTLLVSIPPALENPVVDFLLGEEGKRLVPEMPVLRQSDGSLIRTIPKVQRIRYGAPDRVPGAVFEAAAETGFYIARSPVMMEGRIELIHYFQEQAVSDTYHRYGNLGERALTE
jgi:RHH-type proline utilization regulon transcriptional repressor/proline dehydrogenase/delta 1-pyrroline-5-carboxylate dehydrogenase